MTRKTKVKKKGRGARSAMKKENKQKKGEKVIKN
jgi:hypothetical protein